MMSTKLTFVPPETEVIPCVPETIVCQSPVPGGNEGIGFENWN